METTVQIRRPWLGGVISGFGLGIILLAAIEEFTNHTFKNNTRLILGLGLLAMALGCALAQAARRKQPGAEPG